METFKNLDGDYWPEFLLIILKYNIKTKMQQEAGSLSRLSLTRSLTDTLKESCNHFYKALLQNFNNLDICQARKRYKKVVIEFRQSFWRKSKT